MRTTYGIIGTKHIGRTAYFGETRKAEQGTHNAANGEAPRPWGMVAAREPEPLIGPRAGRFSRTFVLVTSSQIEGTEIEGGFVDPGGPQTASCVPAACRSVHRSVCITGAWETRLVEPRCGG